MATKDFSAGGFIQNLADQTKNVAASGYVLPDGFTVYRGGIEVTNIAGLNDFEQWRTAFSPVYITSGRFLLFGATGYIHNGFILEFASSGFCAVESVKSITADGILELSRHEVQATGVVSIPNHRLLPLVPPERVILANRFPSIP